MNKMQFFKYFSNVFLLFLFVTACGKSDDLRTYSEEPVKTTTTDNSKVHGNMPEMKTAHDIEWDTPSTWKPVKSESKMRIATFSIKAGNEEALCTMIPLRGDGGGLGPNVNMWYSALAGKEADKNKVKEFMKKSKNFKTDTGFDTVLVDFLGINSKDNMSSMLVSVITLNNRTLFIKLTGPKKLVEKNRDKFLSLTKSIRLKK